MRHLLASAMILAFSWSSACTGGDAFSGSKGGGGTGLEGGQSNSGNAGGNAEEAGGPSLPSDGGQAAMDDCVMDEDCGAGSTCLPVTCLDGTCSGTPAAENTPCDGGACDAAGQCQASSCDSSSQDGDETGVDCGGSCPLCADGQGCAGNTDCLSGVCEGGECQPSDCTDEVKNGSETDVDCGGTCALNCALGEGCSVVEDCAIAPGDRAESVRCLESVCTSTKPPGAVGVPLYWQDFAPVRLGPVESCGATDGMCLTGNGPAYPLHGLGSNEAKKALTADSLLTTEGVVGSAGKLDGSTCLMRAGTNLSLADLGAFTAMAWVKSGRAAAPWESAIVGSPNHYFLAVDANPASERFLAALATSQSASFEYRSSAATGEVVAGDWHHVAAVYDTALAKLVQYVDGEVVQTTALSGNITSGDGHVYLGCRKDATLGQFFIGSLDEVVLYRRALSADELTDYVRRSSPTP
jgi:hypothetical protein